jgi:hypothetical protein
MSKSFTLITHHSWLRFILTPVTVVMRLLPAPFVM